MVRVLLSVVRASLLSFIARKLVAPFDEVVLGINLGKGVAALIAEALILHRNSLHGVGLFFHLVERRVQMGRVDHGIWSLIDHVSGRVRVVRCQFI